MRKLLFPLGMLCALTLCNAIAAVAEDHTVYLVSQTNRTISDIDSLSGKVLVQTQLEGAPTDVAESWDEQWLFVSEPDLGYIAVLDAHTLKEASRLSKPEFKRAAGSQAHILALATTPNHRYLYVSVPGGLEKFDQWLLAYNPEYKQPEHKIALTGQDGQRMLVQGPTDKLYYAFKRDNQVAVVDTNTDKVLKTIAVKGGPMDVSFVIGGEAWVAAADGSVSVIDTNKDEVVKTIETGGKGPGQITIASDIRYLAFSHDDSGDVSILQPMTKEVVGTIKIGKGPLSVAFTPAGSPAGIGGPPLRGADGGEIGRSRAWPPTNQLYVGSPSGLSVVDLDKMAVADSKDADQVTSLVLIHYSFANGFEPPREGTSTRIMENDTYTLYDNAMFNYDVSPIHEHRTDMVAVEIGDGVAKIGCWKPECPPVAVPKIAGGLPYSNTLARAGGFTGVPRGTLHIEEGASPSPRRMDIFMPKNNYYRQMNPKAKSDFQGKPGFSMLADNSRAWLWNLELIPGKPVHFPKTDYAFVYLAGGLIRETRGNVPDVEHRLFAQWDTDSSEKTVEALSNRIALVVVEFK